MLAFGGNSLLLQKIGELFTDFEGPGDTRGSQALRGDMRLGKSAEAPVRCAAQPAQLTAPGGSVHGERANFTRLVLGCIEASKQASKVEQSLSWKKEKRRDPGMRVQLKYT